MTSQNHLELVQRVTILIESVRPIVLVPKAQEETDGKLVEFSKMLKDNDQRQARVRRAVLKATKKDKEEAAKREEAHRHSWLV